MNTFLDMFGTHAIRQVNMGAKYVSIASYDKEQASVYEKEGKRLNFSAQVSGNYAGWGFSANASNKSSSNRSSSSR